MEHQSVVNGVLVPSFVTQLQVDSFKQLPCRPDDVWVVAYPKSGTTWLQSIVSLIRTGGVDDERPINEAVPWAEVEGYGHIEDKPIPRLVDISSLPFPRAFKSHFSYDTLPCGPPISTPCKYIYIARNPKDVAVSLFCFTQGFRAVPRVSWSDFLRQFFNGNVFYGSWFDHVLSFWAHKDDDNILFLKYADMKKDLPTAVAAVAKFMGYDLTQDVISEIVTKTSFENAKNNSWVHPLAGYPMMNEILDIDPNGPPFARKGEVGDWKNYFTPEQSAQFDAIYAERMKGTGLE